MFAILRLFIRAELLGEASPAAAMVMVMLVGTVVLVARVHAIVAILMITLVLVRFITAAQTS